MLENPVDNEVPQIRRLQEWWLELPLSYRVNALLYLGGGLLLVFLLFTLLAGGDSKPRQIEVGAGAPSPTTTLTPRAPVAPPPTATATSTSSSTTVVPPTTTVTISPALRNTPVAGNATTGGATTNGGGGGGGGASAVDGGDTGGGGGGGETPPVTEAPPTTTTTEVRPCRNSQESRCGDFSWDPQLGPNEPLNVTVTVKTPNPKVNQAVEFEVTVTDPDHDVSANCAEIQWGDGTPIEKAPCAPHQTDCPPHYGPWTPPERGGRTFTYSHTYGSAGLKTATFKFSSGSPERCAALDPDASTGEGAAQVTIAMGT